MQDLVPQPGIEPGPPALGAWSLTHWTTREVLHNPVFKGGKKFEQTLHQGRYIQMANEHMKTCSPSLVIKEMQGKTQ